MRFGVVVNPIAGSGVRSRFTPSTVGSIASAVAAELGADATVMFSERPGGGRDAARRLLDAGCDVIVAWGGDGTVNEVASVLAGTSARLAIVPAGSGNGLALEFGIPKEPRDALLRLATGQSRSIDLGLLNDRVFVNVAGFGFDAHVAARFNATPSSRGFLRYVQLVIRELPAYRSQCYDVTWDGASVTQPALIVACANSRQYGNGARLAPRASLTDGELDLVLIRPASIVRDLWRARRLFVGGLDRDPGVTMARFRHLRIRGEQNLVAHVDGEPLSGAGSDCSVTVWPRALNVCV